MLKGGPNPKDEKMPKAHSNLSEQDQAQIRDAHLNEANETLAKSFFLSKAREALKSVLVRLNPSYLKEAVQIAT